MMLDTLHAHKDRLEVAYTLLSIALQKDGIVTRNGKILTSDEIANDVCDMMAEMLADTGDLIEELETERDFFIHFEEHFAEMLLGGNDGEN